MSEQERPYVTLLLVLLAYSVGWIIGGSIAWSVISSDGTDVGRSTGHAVVEQYDTSWVTTDPSWNPVVDPDGCGCVPLPDAAPGSGR